MVSDDPNKKNDDHIIEVTEMVSPADERVAALMSHTIDVSALATAVTKQKAADAADTLEDLDEESLVRILLEPKNSLIKQYKRLFEFENAKLIFKDEAIKEIARKAINKKTGARGLRSIIESLLLKTMFKLPAMEDIQDVIVSGSVVKNNTQPIITHSKTKKTSAA